MFNFFKAKLYSVCVGVIIILLTLAYVFGRKDERDRRQLRDLKQSVRTLRESEEIEDEVEALSVNDLSDQLNKWMRDRPL